MDLGNPWALLSGILIGLVGMALFIRGKKKAKSPASSAAAALCIYPYFVTDMLLIWSLFALCITGIWWLKRFD